ncbi:MAG: DUF748 domain-containing protein [Bacteroidales bacterium]|nr:DUF748 domain-containing protein [Bacteroidales bacterium]
MKKFIKVLLWIVGIVAALLLVVSLVGGPVAKGYVNRHGESLTGRRVEVGNIGLNLFTGHVYMRGLTVYEDDAATPFAGFDTLDVRVHLLQLPFRTVNVRHLTLSGLHATALQDGERFNFSTLIEHFASDDEDDQDTTPSRWTLKFYNLRLAHASLHYRDLRGNKELSLPDVNLRVPGFVLGGDEATEGGLNLSFDKGGHLAADAHYDADKKQYQASVDLTGFALRNVEGYVRDIIELDEVGGTLTAHLTASGGTSHLLQSRISANVALTDMELRSDHDRLAAMQELTVKVNNVNLEQNSFDVAEVHLNGLTATYEQWDGYSNISRLMKAKDTSDIQTPGDSTASDTTGTAAKKPLRLRVGNLLVEHCALTYINHTLPDEFRFPIINLTVNANNLTLSGDNNAQLRATLPGGGHLMARWEGNLDNWKQHQSLFLTVKGLDLKQISPWTVAYTGQPVEDGVFGLTSRNSINNSMLNGQNTIDIYNPVVGKKRKDVKAEKHLPLKAALYVLKDKDGKILLDVPVKGNIDSPEFNYMKLVWKTLGNLIVKVATSPARALGNALGMGGSDLEFIAVNPAQHGLTSEQYHTLGQLATIAQSDSLIVLHLEQHMPEAANDTVAHGYEMRNAMVRRYLAEQGLSEEQYIVTTGDPVGAKEPTGYAVSSEMKIEE